MTYEGPKALLTAWVSLVSNLLLTLLKLIFGLVFHSTALVADGVHNGGDVIASVATIGSMKLSNHPADREHPYGHGKAEDLSTAFISIILIAAALFLTFEAIKALFAPALPISVWAFGAALVSALSKWLLYRYTNKAAVRYHSKSLRATASDHLADIYASFAAAIGLGISWIGSILHIPYTHYGDPLAGIVVSLLIFRIAVIMIVKASNVLMESSVDAKTQEKYSAVILSFPEVKKIDILRAREHGNAVLIDAQIRIPGSYTIQEGDDLTEAIRSKMLQAYPDVEEVLIHINPWYEDQELVEPDSVPHLDHK
ncbi:cobalt-zinc-cadmium resistance protein [Sporolactobacillus inulinus]|jgi:cation diffusion facilitator family transporter|uniref:Cobalt-zinc-cadmium resistance protein n=1 Tax=Sporolactobacillus inulinus TaxID=2078 RepID=A0A4Y1ZIB8_9BACL|nr:cation diffusion facilitator family transporter [Sporolactobacillus inulinus]GAY78887.1 cobalt-zinc-cadmium resistance protein [Sporolactobacillus inulinus]